MDSVAGNSVLIMNELTAINAAAIKAPFTKNPSPPYLAVKNPPTTDAIIKDESTIIILFNVSIY
jgi:hypothetical protein